MPSKFSIIWANNVTRTRPMSRYRVTLRDVMQMHASQHVLEDGRTATLHLDQVQIVFRPSSDIGSTEFWANDNTDKTWRVETYQLMVRTHPGVTNTLYVTQPGAPDVEVTAKQPLRAVHYSTALSLVPNVDGNEDYWVRTYRPIRDTPVAYQVEAMNELEVELFFPLILGDNTAPYDRVPDYRILKVYCEFSINR